MGNLRSAEKALERVGAEPLRTGDASVAAEADGIVLPGVGAFPEAMRRIGELGFDGLISDAVAREVPVIGICLGMQLLFEGSSEHEGADGLGLVAGRVERLEAPGLKVPHIGWEEVRWTRDQEPLTDGIESWHAVLLRPLAGTTRRGSGDARCLDLRRSGVRQRDRRVARLRRPVPPREVERGRIAVALQLRRYLRSSRDRRVNLYPAIDIRGGQAVRLLQGDYERETVYDTDPIALAARWVEAGRAAVARGRSRRRPRGPAGERHDDRRDRLERRCSRPGRRWPSR